jgi:hypothetical protein
MNMISLIKGLDLDFPLLKYSFYPVVLLVLLACSNTNDENVLPADLQVGQVNQITGEWHLIERLVDPGDGSGTFQPVSENKSITFLNDLKFESSQSLCFLITGSHDVGTGTYSPEAGTITPENCDVETELQFEINDNEMIIYYLCIEQCAEKYSKSSSSN